MPEADKQYNDDLAVDRDKADKVLSQVLAKHLKRHNIIGWRSQSSLPGHPHFVWAKERIAVFTHECFWYGHDCSGGVEHHSWETADDIMQQRNWAQARTVNNQLRAKGWTVKRVWGCELQKPGLCLEKIRSSLQRKRAHLPKPAV